MTLGGFGDVQEVNEEVSAIVMAQQSAVEAMLKQKFATFEPKTFRSQMVAGTNFKVKVHVGDGQFVHVKICQPLPHTGMAPFLSEAEAGKTEADHLEFGQPARGRILFFGLDPSNILGV